MYQVIGIQRNTQQRLLATPSTAKAALAAFYKHRDDYTAMIIHDPEGSEIDLDSLRRAAEAEADHA